MAEQSQQPEQGEKTFTQADVDAIVGKRLSEERKKYPTAEEMTAFNSWKSAQQTGEQKLTAMTAERDTAKAALAQVNTSIVVTKVC